MKYMTETGIVTLVLLILALPIAILADSSKVQGDAWKIGPRMLPVPLDVSDVMRESLLKTSTPDVEAARKFVPQTIEQWKALISERDAKAAAGAKPLPKRFRLPLSTRESVGLMCIV